VVHINNAVLERVRNLTAYELKKRTPLIQRSQWPRGLRRGSAAARLLTLWVRIPPGERLSVVSVVEVEVSATS